MHSDELRGGLYPPDGGDPVDEFRLHTLRAVVLLWKKNSSSGEEGISYEMIL